MSDLAPRVTADKAAAALGVLAAFSAAGCFALGQPTAGVISILVVFASLTWLGAF